LFTVVPLLFRVHSECIHFEAELSSIGCSRNHEKSVCPVAEPLGLQISKLSTNQTITLHRFEIATSEARTIAYCIQRRDQEDFIETGLTSGI